MNLDEKMSNPMEDRSQDPTPLTALGQTAPALASESGASPTDLLKTLHELEVHKIELEMQNEELRQSRRELELALERYTDLYDFAPVGYLTLDGCGNIILLNLKASALLGSSRSLLLNQPLGAFLAHADRSKFHKLLDLVFSEKKTINEEFEIISKTQKSRFVQIEATPNADRSTCRTIVIDVTDRKNAEEIARAGEERFRTFLTHAPVAAWIVDHQGSYELANPKFLEILGLPILQVLGKTEAELLPEISETNLNENVRLADSHDPCMDTFQVRSRRDDSVRELMVVKFPMRDYDGRRLIGALGQDVTELKHAQNQLELARNAADRANQAKSFFLAKMSHEIRTPLTAILGFSEILQDDSINDSTRIKSTQSLHYCSQHLLQILNDQLDLAKIEAGQMEADFGDFSPWLPVSETLTMFMGVAARKGIELSAGVDNLTPRIIRSDPLRIRQILSNLVGNAIKFTNVGQVRIRLGYRPPAGDDPDVDSAQGILTFEVQDQGRGMTLSEIDRLFQPFMQADTSITKHYGGTGLGLTIARHLALLIGGAVEVHSQFGVGSQFTLRLPVPHNPDEPLVDPSAADRFPGAGDGLITPLEPQVVSFEGSILIVEDASEIREVLSYYFQQCGKDILITFAEDGQAALNLASSRPFDLILMDANLPILDGYSATKQLRSRGYSAPIVALSANAMTDEREICLSYGFNEYLLKPVNLLQLRRLAQRYLPSRPHPGHHPSAPAPEPEIRSHPNIPQCGDANVDAISDRDRDREYQTILAEFLSVLPRYSENLHTSLSHSDIEDVFNISHKLNGMCGMYGYPQLSKIAAEMEAACKQSPVNPILLAELLEKLDQSMPFSVP